MDPTTSQHRGSILPSYSHAFAPFLPNGTKRAATQLQSYRNSTTEPVTEVPRSSPIASGLAISIGYTVGGVSPLSPYLFTNTIGTGLLWSTILCLLALFMFGSGKAWLLHGKRRGWMCLWDGLHILILGTVAAGSAVTCIKGLQKESSVEVD